MKPESVSGTGLARRAVAPWVWTGLGNQILESLAGPVEEFDFL